MKRKVGAPPKQTHGSDQRAGGLGALPLGESLDLHISYSVHSSAGRGNCSSKGHV